MTARMGKEMIKNEKRQGHEYMSHVGLETAIERLWPFSLATCVHIGDRDLCGFDERTHTDTRYILNPRPDNAFGPFANFAADEQISLKFLLELQTDPAAPFLYLVSFEASLLDDWLAPTLSCRCNR